LRTKVSVFFGLLALITTVTLSVVTYTFARTLLLRERATEAQQLAIENALIMRQQLSDPDREAFFQEFGDRVPP
jgi:hypothetical protein